MHSPTPRLVLLALIILLGNAAAAVAQEDTETLRVFIFAGQSNMVGSDSRVADIQRFPPFEGLEHPQDEVRFSYCIGRENKQRSQGWVPLAPVNGVVGPELSFARTVTENIDAPIAVIKVAAGGTHLGGDWNPEEPSGFEMYPLALDWVRSSLAALDEKRVPYRIEGFVWHQGENDMFEEEYMASYGKNLEHFLDRWRRDLKVPELRFFIGELCTKTIWGMDHRPCMYAISLGQRQVTDADPLADFVPTSHVGVEIGGGVGLHYHYGTLGQLEHGVNHADAYLKSIGRARPTDRPLEAWPYSKGGKVKLFVLAGHRNMEGERAFVQELAELKGGPALLADNPRIAYRYSIGGGYRTSDGWEPLGPAGFYDTFGPELSFAATVEGEIEGDLAIVKFTHSGSQIIDWTPKGSEAVTRNLYPSFVEFVRESMRQLTERGQEVELAGILYHIGENDMSWGHFRRGAAARLQSIVEQSRDDLDLPALRWFVSQQPPTDDERVNDIDVTAQVEEVAAADPLLIHVKAFDLPPQEKKLVLDTEGVVALGERLARSWLANRGATSSSALVEPPSDPDHVVREIQGWSVHVDRALLEGELVALGDEALKLLDAKLLDVHSVLPARRVDELQQVPIWLDAEHPLESLQYHPDAGWLVAHGYDPRLEKAVHVPRARNFVDLVRSNRQPWVMLHELAHAWHDQVLGFDHPGIRAAWEAAQARGNYESVLHVSGKQRRHYALTNHKEFFAECSEAYFGTNDFYPFVRAELAQHDPGALEILEETWNAR